MTGVFSDQKVVIALFLTILFLDTHAKILQVRTYLDIILACNLARSWQDFPRLSRVSYQDVPSFSSLGTVLVRIKAFK